MAAGQCIVVADRARARLFTIDESQDAPFQPTQRRLTEQTDLISPEGKLTDQELFRDRRAGRGNRSSVAGGGYGLDDGKGRQREEAARRFAKAIVTSTLELVRARRAGQLVIVASPKFLGFVRPALRKALPKSVRVKALAEDLTWHTQPHIEKVLARHGVLENHEPPEAGTRPRGGTRRKKKAKTKRA